MSWTDKSAIKCIKYLRDKYDIKTFIETGTFCGINARLHSKNFKNVMTCENYSDYFIQASAKLKNHSNVITIEEDSPVFLSKISVGTYIFYLDAHFYNPNILKEDRFIVLKELENMTKFKDSVIIIHDFDNGLGHITYDGIKLNMDLVRSRLKKISKTFFFYTNRLESCDIVKPEASDMIEAGLQIDFDTLDNINYAWKAPRLTYRGILYCLPTELSDEELNNLGLREWS